MTVTVQKPLMPPPKKPAPKKHTTSSINNTSSSVNVPWKNESSRSNVSTLVPTSTSFSTSDAETRVVVALSEGRGEAKHEVGIAAVDVSRPSLILCQISDSQSYMNTLTKINILNPDEILIPMTFVRTDLSNRLTEKIKEHFKHVLITAVPRSTFDKTTGMQFVREFCAPQWNSVTFLLQHRYYALAAASALFTYIEKVLCVLYVRESLKVEYQESEGFAFIDIATADGLELVASTSPVAEKKFTSLLGVLNHCLTRIGGRMLRSSILQPPCSIPDIEARLDCVMELRSNPDLMTSVQSILSKLTNVDQLLSVSTIVPSQEINFSERQMNYMLKLNVLLETISPLSSVLKNHELPFLADLKDTLRSPTFTSIKNSIRDMIHSDAHPAKGQQGNFQRCFAIKSDVNGLLDLVRKAYSERIEEMREYVQRLGTKCNLPLSVSHNNKKGFHIVYHLNQRQRAIFKKSDLPEEFIQIDRLSTCVTMKTMELLNWATKIDMIQVEILKISNVMIYNLLLEVRQNIGLFYTLCEGIGKLDMLQSLAQASSTNNYIRPVFCEFLEVKDSRHPLLDFLCSMEPIPNTIFATDMHNVHVVTGPNGSGKSIFIRQVLLLQVMAQVGSFVPAESARFRICDRILARISFDDNIEFGVSTFALEIKEIEYFQTMMTNNTLIIIDELGRSTSVEEGTALAMAICEDFAETNAFVFFTTHFVALAKLESFHLNVTNWQLETHEETIPCGRRKLTYTYNLIPGVTKLKNYGICCARSSWPEEIVLHAEKLLKNVWQSKPNIAVFEIGPDERLKYNLEADLKVAKLKKRLSPTLLHSYLLKYIEEMNEFGWHIDLSEITTDFCGSGNNDTPPPPPLSYEIRGTPRKIACDYKENGAIPNFPQADIFLAPLERDEMNAISDQTDVASRFNESLQNSMYLIPEVVYSQSVNEAYKSETSKGCYVLGAEVQSFSRGNCSNEITLNTSLNCHVPQNFSEIPQSSLRINCTGFGLFEDLNASPRSRSPFCNAAEDYDNVSAISSQRFLAKYKQNLNERDWATPPNDTSQYKFSLPLQENAERTSTPLATQSSQMECSEEWHTASENSISKNVDQDVSGAIDDLRSCSEYFSQDWEELRDQNNLAPTGNRIQIHSMYVFDANNQLIQVVKPAETHPIENSVIPMGETQILPKPIQLNQDGQNQIKMETGGFEKVESEYEECNSLKPQSLITHVGQVPTSEKFSSEQVVTKEKVNQNEMETVSFENVQRELEECHRLKPKSLITRVGHSDNAPQECRGLQLLTSGKFSADLAINENVGRNKAMKAPAKIAEITPLRSVPTKLLQGTSKGSLCRHSSVETCTSKCIGPMNYVTTNVSDLHNALSISDKSQLRYLSRDYTKRQSTPAENERLKVQANEVKFLKDSQSRHLSENYIKEQFPAVIESQFFKDDEGKINCVSVKTRTISDMEELIEVSQLRYPSENDLKVQTKTNVSEFLNASESKYVDHKGQRNGMKTSPNKGELQEVSQSRYPSENYVKVQSPAVIESQFHQSENYIKEQITPHSIISPKSHEESPTKNLNINTSNLGELREVSQSRHQPVDYMKQLYACGYLKISSSRSVDDRSQAIEKIAKRTPNLGTLTEEVPQLQHFSSCRSKEESFHSTCQLLPLKTSSLLNKEKTCLSNISNPELQAHQPDYYVRDQFSGQITEDAMNCSFFNAPQRNLSKISCGNQELIENQQVFETSIRSSDDIIDTSQKTDIAEFVPTISETCSWLRQKWFRFGNSGNFPENSSTTCCQHKINLPLIRVSEQDNIITSTPKINSLNDVKRARLSPVVPCEAQPDKKYEEIETFEDIGSCKPKSTANIFGDPTDDVNFDLGHNLSLDLFSDVTVAVSTPVASSSDEFRSSKEAKPKSKPKSRKMKPKSKFVPPKILTKKEIQTDYFRQDLEMINVKDETALMKYHRQILNRPSVQQLQQQRHLAVLRNTGEGFEVIPAVTVPKKRRKGFPLQKRDSATNFDITLFSDKNSDKFEKFLEGKKSESSSSNGVQFRLQIEPSEKPRDDLFLQSIKSNSEKN